MAHWAKILVALAGIALAWRPSPASRPIAVALLLFTAIIALLRLLGLVRRGGGTLGAS